MNLFIQAVHFIGISGIGWLIDFTIFNILNFFGINVVVCNCFSSLVAVAFVFIVSTRKTFIQKEAGIPLKVKFLIYVLYQAILILVMSWILSLINEFLISWFSGTNFENLTAMISKIAVTPITMTLNFIVMKFLIERI